MTRCFVGDARTDDRSGALLSIRGARVVRDGATILDVEAFDIHAGERLAVLGPNGAGKSTLIGLLTRDVLPLWTDPPPVLFQGESRPELDEVRSLIGVVTSAWQDMVRVHLRVEDVVCGGLFGAVGVPSHRRGRATKVARDAAAGALERVGIGHLASRDMATLSTGEARRVLIARALVHDPRILVLDEPTAGLDPTAAWQLRATMRSLAAEARTIVLVTHHVEDIVREVERVVLMRQARVVADGPKADLLTSEVLSDLFSVELEVEERDGEYRLW